jgi:hypothetical protein
MAKIPLNLFRRYSSAVTNIPKIVYTAPFERAGIIINGLATNLTNVPQTITASISTDRLVDVDGTITAATTFDILRNFELPPNDAVNLVINKLGLFQGDHFVISCPNSTDPNNPTVNLTLSVLESVNIP